MSALTLGAALSHAQTDLIYSDNLTKPSNTNLAITSSAWNFHYGTGTLGVSEAGAQNGGNTDPLNVNAGTAGSGINMRTFLTGGTLTGNDALFWTDEYTVDRSPWSPATVLFETSNPASSINASVALRIGDPWFASQQVFTATTSGKGTRVVNTFNWSNDADAWAPSRLTYPMERSAPRSASPPRLSVPLFLAATSPP